MNKRAAQTQQGARIKYMSRVLTLLKSGLICSEVSSISPVVPATPHTRSVKSYSENRTRGDILWSLALCAASPDDRERPRP